MAPDLCENIDEPQQPQLDETVYEVLPADIDLVKAKLARIHETAMAARKNPEISMGKFIGHLETIISTLELAVAKDKRTATNALFREHIAVYRRYRDALSACLPKPEPVKEELPTGVERHPEGFEMQLELGKWTKASINAMLIEAQKIEDMNARVAFVCNKLRGTPFTYESLLPIPTKGRMRVRLESLDCITFIHYTLALANASDFNGFVSNLRKIRYKDAEKGKVDSDPDHGNIYDFSYNIYLDNALERGLAENVTEDIARGGNGVVLSATLRGRRRDGKHDKNRTFVRPKAHENERVSATFIRSDRISAVEDKIQTGDIILFSRGGDRMETGEDGQPKMKWRHDLINHGAIAMKKADGHVYFMHSTGSYFYKPGATKGTPPVSTGIYYGNDPKREQIGANVQGAYLEHAGTVQDSSGATQYGYDPNRPRLLSEYAANFAGIIVLRPSTPTPDLPLAYRGAR